jgi:hypothetical protein
MRDTRPVLIITIARAVFCSVLFLIYSVAARLRNTLCSSSFAPTLRMSSILLGPALHLLIPSSTHSRIHSFTHSRIHPYTHLLIHITTRNFRNHGPCNDLTSLFNQMRLWRKPKIEKSKIFFTPLLSTT